MLGIKFGDKCVNSRHALSKIYKLSLVLVEVLGVASAVWFVQLLCFELFDEVIFWLTQD